MVNYTKKIMSILMLFAMMIALSYNVSAFCLFGVIGNTCETQEEFYPEENNIATPIGEVIPIEEKPEETEEIIEDTKTEVEEETEQIEETPKEEIIISDEEKQSADIIINVVEEDLIDLNPVAIDPDGDDVTYSFSEPFSPNGLWQTKRGDTGKYLVTITATDGELSTVQDALIVVGEANNLPIVECSKEIKVKEGEEVKLNCNAYDPDDEALIITYEGWMESGTKQTNYDDAGTYTTHITVSDGENRASTDVTVTVTNTNRAPIIEELNDIYATETEVIVIDAKIEDPDGDEIEITYGEPLNDEGIFRTEDGDSGEYIVTITASDGDKTTKESFTLTIDDINTAPTMETISDIIIEETETVEINVEATDAEGDEITIIYEGWMETNTKQTNYDDAGTYTVTIAATDGEKTTSQEVNIIVHNKNRAPTFVIPA